MKNNISKNTVIFISSTGGHLTELLQLKPIFANYNSYIITEKQSNNINLKNDYPNKVKFIIPGTYTGLKNKLKYPLILFANTILSLIYFIQIKPNCIVTTGAHNVVPICYIAHLFHKKVIFIETFAALEKPTKAGRIVYKIADYFIVQWENMINFYPKAIYGGWIF